jgi:histidinol dehydrogenase
MSPEFHFADYLRLGAVPVQERTIKNTLVDPELFDKRATAILQKLEPKITEYIKELDVPAMANKCTTYEELEAYKPMSVPSDFFENLADAVSLQTTEPIEATMLYVECGKTIVGGTVEYITTVLRQRAQVILRSTPQIILP